MIAVMATFCENHSADDYYGRCPACVCDDLAAAQSKLEQCQKFQQGYYNEAAKAYEERDAALRRLDSCEERFRAARDAWDVLFNPPPAQPDAVRLQAHQALIDAISGAKFVKPDAADLRWAAGEIARLSRDVEKLNTVGEPK